MSNISPQASPPPFEEACQRLESILERMNSEGIGLDESVKLFEEADALIRSAQGQLGQAEQRIELLLKNRDGQVLTDANGQAQTQGFPNQEAGGHPTR